MLLGIFSDNSQINSQGLGAYSMTLMTFSMLVKKMDVTKDINVLSTGSVKLSTIHVYQMFHPKAIPTLRSRVLVHQGRSKKG